MARYTINDIELPGVTSILGLLDKSTPLMIWAVNCMGDYILENAVEVNVHNAFEKTATDKTYKTIDVELIEEAKKNYRNVSKTALDNGSTVHNIIEQYIKAKLNGDHFDQTEFQKFNDEVENSFLAFLEWEAENVEHWIESETPVASLKYGFAGTLDALVMMKTGKVACIDFKSSKAIYDDYIKQISAYKVAREEMLSFNCQFKGDDFNYTKHIELPEIQIDEIGILRLDKKTGMPEYKDVTKKGDRAFNSFTCLIDFYYTDKKRRLKNNPFVF